MIFLALLILILIPAQAVINILEFGAVMHTDTIAVQFANSKAIKQAILKANQTEMERVVKIPKGVFYIMPIVLENIHNLSIVIEGKISASKSVIHWPRKAGQSRYENIISISKSSHIEISGGGKVDGRGYHWWLIQWLRLKKYMPPGNSRPHMFAINSCSNFKIHDLTVKNSPCFHFLLSGCSHFEMYSLDIKVNTTAQFNLAKKFSAEGVLPNFPLNTDGIDPSGQYFHIWNITVQNFDDVVVPKPSHSGSDFNCTEHILVENVTVRLGVGLSIGSVPPNTGHNCIRNVTFINADFKQPFKGIYLKTNPGDKGSGEITNIRYRNMRMTGPIWWAIYLGPQQQKQPDGGGPGCMLYPFDPKGTCQTQPRINIRNVTLQNVEIHNSLLFPIVVRCNETNPCTGINFKNVNVDRWTIGDKGKGYVCEHASGQQEGGHPKLDCLKQALSDSKKQLSSRYEEYKYSARDVLEIWRKLEQAVMMNPYEDEDDQMQENLEAIQLFSVIRNE